VNLPDLPALLGGGHVKPPHGVEPAEELGRDQLRPVGRPDQEKRGRTGTGPSILSSCGPAHPSLRRVDSKKLIRKGMAVALRVSDLKQSEILRAA
jgi:hypothetical protein